MLDFSTAQQFTSCLKFGLNFQDMNRIQSGSLPECGTKILEPSLQLSPCSPPKPHEGQPPFSAFRSASWPSELPTEWSVRSYSTLWPNSSKFLLKTSPKCLGTMWSSSHNNDPILRSHFTETKSCGICEANEGTQKTEMYWERVPGCRIRTCFERSCSKLKPTAASLSSQFSSHTIQVHSRSQHLFPGLPILN